MMHTKMVFALSIISPDLEVSINLHITLQPVGLISDMITANEKILGKLDCSQNVHHEVFSPHLVNH